MSITDDEDFIAVHRRIWAAHEEHRSIDEQTARRIAAWYQSPGAIGHTLAAFASGSPVAATDAMTDIAKTKDQFGSSDADIHAELDALDDYFARMV
jgi:hypothetical protein